jgi:hypothetical protein
LLQKYKGIRFYDEDEEVAFKIIDTNVERKRKIRQIKKRPATVF